MTPDTRERLKALAESWRKNASNHDATEAGCAASYAFTRCADELEALLSASPVPQEARCVCEVDDGLVREWVQKAREAARGKGFNLPPLPSPAGEES